MVDLKFDADEGILLQTSEACRYCGDNEYDLNELFLTNKNIVYVYDKSNGLFSKSETIAEKVPLNSIKVINGVVQVQQVNDSDYGNTLQILYKNGKRELIELYDSPKKEYPRWKEAITNIVLQFPQDEPVIVTAQEETVSTTQQETIQPKTERQQFPNENKEMRFCSYCGTKLDIGARFCKNCGEAVVGNVQHTVTPPKEKVVVEEPSIKENPTERKTVYEGKIHKCPNCGEVMKSFSANCPSCGYEIRGARVTTSVQELARKLEKIESQVMPAFEEKKSIMKKVFGRDFNNEDELEEAQDRFDEQKALQKANLIANFPVPNTREDMLEFMILVASNINVKKGIDDEVSKAWLSKLEQVYQKAELSTSPADFAKIKAIYDKKKKEIKDKKIKGILFGFGLAGAYFFLMGLLWNPVATVAIAVFVIVAIIGCYLLLKKR